MTGTRLVEYHHDLLLARVLDPGRLTSLRNGTLNTRVSENFHLQYMHDYCQRTLSMESTPQHDPAYDRSGPPVELPNVSAS